MLSPYLSFPFTEVLGAAAKRGVEVVVLSPRANNKQIVRDALMAECAAHGLEMRLLPKMSHLKAMLIDDQTLVVGSTNFDFVSYHTQEELYALIDDSSLCHDFRVRILDAALATSERLTTRARYRSYLSHKVLRCAALGTKISAKLGA